ncbi:MAG: UxaA family hydrolase, partial [Vallitaleaceae bacterium]|nr:UxaA family hydrolase [Vallitaleaceae bacterium]
ELAQKKPGWIDFNAGVLVDGVDMEALLGEFIDRIVDIANGEKTKQEINDYREIAIFKSGVTL